MKQLEKDTLEVYVELLDEGTETWRPTQAVKISEDIYKLLPTPDYDPEDEAWAFLPKTEVRLEQKADSNGKDILLVRHPNPNAVRINVLCNDDFAIRTTNALDMGNGIYKVLPTPHFNEEEEVWRFPPGSLVRIEEQSDGTFTPLVAVAP